MGILDLFKTHGGTKLPRAMKGMPPLGVRQAGVGDGHTTTNRKVKVKMVTLKEASKHRAGKHKK
jgi:hypothetical protein